MFSGRAIFAIVIVAMLSACSSKLAGMSDADLQDKVYECDHQHSQSPGFAISCDNYRRECKRRRKEGRYVC